METLHPLHDKPVDPVRFGVGHGFFVGEGSLRGVTKVLKRLFAPHYNPKYVRGQAADAAGRARRAGRGKVKGAGRAGMARGKRVDQELTRVVRLLTHARMGVRTWLGDEPLVATVENKEAVEELARLRKAGHPCVRNILNVLANKFKRPLYPIDVQVAVGQFRVLRLGTAVDLVCKDDKGGVWIVEIKTGHVSNYHQYCKQMEYPFEAFVDSPYYQHQIQLLLTTTLYRHTFPHSPVVGACVVRIDDYVAHVYELLPELVKLRPKCLDVIAADLIKPIREEKPRKRVRVNK